MKAYLIAAALCLTGVAPAGAATTTIFWTGKLSSISSQSGTMSYGLSLFDRLYGSITYNDAFNDRDSDPDRLFDDAADASFSIMLGPDTFQWSGMESTNVLTPTYGAIFNIDNSRDTAPTGSLLGIDIFDNDLNEGLASDPDAPGGVAVPITRNGTAMTSSYAHFDLQLDDRDTGLFGSNFDIAALDLGDFSRKFFNFEIGENLSATGGGTQSQNYIAGQVTLDYWATTAPTPVPLPPALPMFAAALTGLGFFGWRRALPAGRMN